MSSQRTAVRRAAGAALAMMICLAVQLSIPVRGQMNPGRVSGTLVDEEGTPVEGVVLRLVNTDSAGHAPRTAKVKKKGRFSASFVPAGRWKIELVDDERFLKSQHYVLKDGSGFKLQEVDNDAHPTEGLPAFQVRVGSSGTLDLILAQQGLRDKLTHQIALADAAGPLKVVVEAYRDGRMEDAIAESTKILAEHPDLARALYMRGLAHWRSAEREAAERDLRAARTRDTDGELTDIPSVLGTVLLERAKALRDAGNEAEAVPMFLGAAEEMAIYLESNPTAEGVLTNRVVALQQAGKRDDDMAAAYEALLEVNPDNLDALVPLAELRASQGKIEASMAVVERLGEGNKDAAAVLFNIAVGYYNESKMDMVISTGLRVLEIDPDHVEVQRMLGHAYLTSDQVEALERLRTFMRICPEGTDATVEQQIAATLEQQLGRP